MLHRRPSVAHRAVVALRLLAVLALAAVLARPTGQLRAAEGSRPVAVRIAAIGVDAPVERLRVVDRRMQNPTGPWVVASYRGLGRLGVPGNVVLAGHRDYAGVGPAVFWRLAELVPGDDVEVVGDDGRTYRFRVAVVVTYAVADAPVRAIVGPTEAEALTLITCAGTFDPATGTYSHRLVVRALRVA